MGITESVEKLQEINEGKGIEGLNGRQVKQQQRREFGTSSDLYLEANKLANERVFIEELMGMNGSELHCVSGS